MKNPKQICEEIVAALTTDTFHFLYGTHPDQNFDADELDFAAKNGICFLDPFKMTAPPNLTNVDVWKTDLALFFAYKQDTDATAEEKLNLQMQAADAAREFYLRMRQYLDPDSPETVIVRAVGDKSLTLVESVFDINLSGCLLEFSASFGDNTSTCIS